MSPRFFRALPLILFTASLPAQTFQATPAAPRQGDTIRVRSSTATSARMNDRTIRLFPQSDGIRLGLMPIHALAKPGKYQLEFLDEKGAVLHSEPILVRDARFRKQNVVLGREIQELKPSPGEEEAFDAFRKTVTDSRHWTEPLAVPVPGCMVSSFGLQRLHNGKPTGYYHGGIDQRSPAGRPVHAVAAGVVKIAGKFNVHGGAVAIDHGQGLESTYLHLSGFATKEGAAVEKGAVIGYVGSTGRSTAPHLHWSLYVNGVSVNPRQWVALKPCIAK